MNLKSINLSHLLELGLRFPEIGAVNFNVLYLILKTIIKKQGLEGVKPSDVMKSERGSPEEFISYLQQGETEYNEEQGKEIQNIEEERYDVNETIKQLMNRVSSLEKISSSQGELKDSIDDTAAVKSDTDALKQHPTDADLQQTINDTNSLKAVHSDLVKKFDELQNDFNAVVDSYSKIVLQVEELEKIISKKVEMEEEIERLKEQMHKLDTFVFSENYEPKEDFNAPVVIVDPEVEKRPAVTKSDHLADTVKDLMFQPHDDAVDLISRSADEHVDDTKKIKPPSRKAYEKFLKIAQKARSSKGDKKTAKETDIIPVTDLQEQEILPVSTFMTTETHGHVFKRSPKKKYKALVHAITIVKDLQKPFIPKDSISVEEDIPSQPDSSSEDTKSEEEISKHQSGIKSQDQMETTSSDSMLSPEYLLAHPRRNTLLLDAEDNSLELKREIIHYFQIRMKEMEESFLQKFNVLEDALVDAQHEASDLDKQIQEVSGRLAAVELSHNEAKEAITVLGKMTNEHKMSIQDIKNELEHKADVDVDGNVTKKDLSTLEDRVYQIHEAMSTDISALEHLLNGTLTRFQQDLDEKISSFEVDIRLEPLASTLKTLEKILHEICLKVHVWEFDHLGPIDFKQYVHCQDGTRVKPLQRLHGLCLSGTQSLLSMSSPQQLQEEKIPSEILTSVQRRLEQASIRDSKRYIDGCFPKLPTRKH